MVGFLLHLWWKVIPPFGGVAGYLYYVRLGSAVVRDDPAGRDPIQGKSFRLTPPEIAG